MLKGPGPPVLLALVGRRYKISNDITAVVGFTRQSAISYTINGQIFLIA